MSCYLKMAAVMSRHVKTMQRMKNWQETKLIMKTAKAHAGKDKVSI